MKKITILALHLGYGGVENAITSLANLLCRKYDVEIVSVYRLYNEPVYKLDERVTVKYISSIKPNKSEMKYYLKKKNFSMFFKGIKDSAKTGYVKYIETAKYLKKIETDVIISTRDVHNYLVGKFAPKNIRKIAWEHNHHNNKKRYINKIVNSVKNVDYFVPVSKELGEFYKEYLNEKVFYIPNCLDEMPSRVSKLDSKNIVSVGRLAKEKGFDDLLKLYKRILNKYPDWKLNIIGDGMEKENLLELSSKLKLGDKVIFHGFQDKDYINEVLSNSSIYIMTSHTESFGLVLIEAMSHGIPCLAYTSAQGANEIISDSIDGFLIKNRDEDIMLEKVEQLLLDDKLRVKMGKKARQKSKEYSGDVVLESWSKLINKRR